MDQPLAEQESIESMTKCLAFVYLVILYLGPPVALVLLGAYIMILKRVRLSVSSEPVDLAPAAAYVIGGQFLALGLGILSFFVYLLFR